MEVRYKNKKYTSCKAVCVHLGLNYNTFKARRAKGWTLEEALTESKVEVILYDGQQYASLRALCKNFDLSYEIVLRKIKSGLSLKEAVEYKYNKRKPRSTEFKGKMYKNKTELFLAYGIDPSKSERLKNGWSIEEALELVSRSNIDKSPIEGIVYLIENKVTNQKYVGITKKTLDHRISQHKISAKNGSLTKLHLAIRYFGWVNFNAKIIDKAKDSVHLTLLEKKYIKQFDSIEKGYNSNAGGAFGGRRAKPIKFKGNYYPSYVSLCKQFDIPEKVFFSRKSRGKTIFQSLGL